MQTPRHLLNALMRLRADGSVSDYKHWLDQLRESLGRGNVPPQLQRDLSVLATRVALMYHAVRAQARYWDLTPQLKAIWESP